MTGPDPKTCGWAALTIGLGGAAVACFTVAARTALQMWRGRAR